MSRWVLCCLRGGLFFNRVPVGVVVDLAVDVLVVVFSWLLSRVVVLAELRPAWPVFWSLSQSSLMSVGLVGVARSAQQVRFCGRDPLGVYVSAYVCTCKHMQHQKTCNMHTCNRAD